MGEDGPKLDREVLAALLKKHASLNHIAREPERDGWTLRKPPSDPETYLRVRSFVRCSTLHKSAQRPGTEPAALQGIEWVLEMYRVGRCPDFRFMYDAQAPAVTELISFLGSSQATVLSNVKQPPLEPTTTVCSASSRDICMFHL